MLPEIACVVCDETEALTGVRSGGHIAVTCGNCGHQWERPTQPMCAICRGTELRPVPMAIVEKSRGTQLSVVGIRTVHLCTDCDADDLERWQRNRPNPLLPKQLPTVDPNG